MSDGIERRKAPRSDIKLRARILIQLVGPEMKKEFFTVNLSRTGMLLEGAELTDFDPKQLLEVWVYSDFGVIFCEARWVRQHNSNEFAIHIENIDEANQERLDAVLHEIESNAIEDHES